MTIEVLVTDYAWSSLSVEKEMLRAVEGEILVAETGEEAELVEYAPRARAILTCWKPVTARVLDAAEQCVIVSTYGVGVDNIDVKRATEHGIMVTNVPDYCVDEVSEHTLALMLGLMRNISAFDRHTRSGGWDNMAFGLMRRVRERVVGLVGFGRIGRSVARKAQALGMRVIAYSPSAEAGTVADGVTMVRSVGELVSRVDVVSVHAPLTEQTRGLLDGEIFARMKPGALLVNTARGPIVDENALVVALREGRCGGAALDVLEKEGPGGGNAIQEFENVIVTPHAAFNSRESLLELRQRATANVVAAVRGECPADVVNKGA